MKRPSIVGKITSAIIKNFDIAPLGKRCNFKRCKTQPSFALRIYLRSLHLNKEVATLYLCAEHLEHARKFVEELNQKWKRVIVEFEIEKIRKLRK